MINVIGDIVGSSGYANHTRRLANALMKFTEIKLTSNIPAGFERNLTDKEIYALKNTKDADTNLIITNPLYWKFNTNAKKNIAYLVWEGDKVPKYFIDEMCNPEIHRIIVPSQHTLQAVLKRLHERVDVQNPFVDMGGTPIPMGMTQLNDIIIPKLRVIPHGVDLDLFYPTEKPKDKFRFIANKGFRNLEDRGGIQYLIQAYIEEFKEDENVELILKINPAYGVPDMNAAIGLIAKGKKFPNILVIAQDVDYKDLVKVYNSANVFVSPTRAEAFNIPCLEAMACGLPVITTAYGGQTDFVSNLNGWLLSYTMTEVKHEIQYEGISWAIPDIEDLKKTLRYAFEHPDQVAGRSILALETAQKLTWDNTAKKILNLS